MRMSRQYLPFYLQEEIVIRKLYSFHYTELSKGYTYPGEKHSFWEFLYVDKGEVEVSSGKKTYLLQQGEMVFYAPNAFHSLRCNHQTPANIFIISFDCQSEAMLFFSNKSLRLGDEEHDLLSLIINEGQRAFSNGQPKMSETLSMNRARKQKKEKLVQLQQIESPYFGSEQLLKNYMEALLIMLIRSNNQTKKQPRLSAITKEKEEQGLAKSIEKYLKERINERLTLEELSADFAFSQTYIRNVFRKYAGCGIMEYLTELKIEKAKMIMRQETWTITEIAEKLGYGSIHYFSRQFKQKTGMSPTEYLRSLKARMNS